MKKKLLIVFLIIILFPVIVKADHIYKIDMDINITKEGSAQITETWDVEADSGSEWYKQMYNMSKQTITDFTVKMDGESLQYKEWNVNESLSDKAGYYGINYTSEGLELCFGKSDMERHEFTLNYKLSNFVFNTSDSQVVYQTLFPNVTLDDFTVTVSSYYEFPDTLDVWGYGYKGYAYVQDGKIKMSNEGSLYQDYVVLLVKFPLETFTTYNSENYTNFDEVLNRAEEGTYEYDYSINNSTNNSDFISTIITLALMILGITGITKTINSQGYGYKNNKTIDKKNTPMFRDIPCNKDIYYANALIKLNNFGYIETNIFGAILLKWIRQNKVIIKNEQTGIFNKETSSIDLTTNPTFDNPTETMLFNIMYEASKDGILQPKELEKWARKNYSKFYKVFNQIVDNEIDNLKSKGKIYKRTDKTECKKANIMDDTIYDDSIKLYGLKKYLKEFSNMKDKEAIEVKLWDEYLMFAYLFNIADKVAKQFQKLYPEVMTEMQNNNIDYGTFMFINSLSTQTSHAASSARAAAESYSSGGGGFSSGGGGGGSFGGGGSMGGR